MITNSSPDTYALLIRTRLGYRDIRDLEIFSDSIQKAMHWQPPRWCTRNIVNLKKSVQSLWTNCQDASLLGKPSRRKLLPQWLVEQCTSWITGPHSAPHPRHWGQGTLSQQAQSVVPRPGSHIALLSGLSHSVFFSLRIQPRAFHLFYFLHLLSPPSPSWKWQQLSLVTELSYCIFHWLWLSLWKNTVTFYSSTYLR